MVLGSVIRSIYMLGEKGGRPSHCHVKVLEGATEKLSNFSRQKAGPTKEMFKRRVGARSQTDENKSIRETKVKSNITLSQ